MSVPNGGAGSNGEARMGLDSRLLVKPHQFDGSKAQSFKQFKFQLLNYVEIADSTLAAAMAVAEKSSSVLSMPEEPQNIVRCKFLYSLLGSLLEGPTLRLITSGTGASERNGLEIWRRITAEFEPKISSRRLALLQLVLKPGFSSEMSDDQWKSAFATWQDLVSQYEELTGSTLDSSTKAALVLDHSPMDIKTHLELSSKDWSDSFDKLVESIMAFFQARRVYNVEYEFPQQPVPMEIDYVKKAGSAALWCKFCKKSGHSIESCWRRQGQPYKPQQQQQHFQQQQRPQQQQSYQQQRSQSRPQFNQQKPYPPRKSSGTTTSSSSSAGSLAKKGSQNPKCYKCLQRGHFASHCKAKFIKSIDEVDEADQPEQIDGEDKDQEIEVEQGDCEEAQETWIRCVDVGQSMPSDQGHLSSSGNLSSLSSGEDLSRQSSSSFLSSRTTWPQFEDIHFVGCNN